MKSNKKTAGAERSFNSISTIMYIINNKEIGRAKITAIAVIDIMLENCKYSELL